MNLSICELLYKHFSNLTTDCQKHLDRYVKFIDSCQNHVWVDNVYCELHHIVPRSWGGSNCQDNIVRLPYKAHIIAHQLLAKTGDPSMQYAVWCMIHRAKQKLDKPFLTIDQLQKIRQQCAVAEHNKHLVNLSNGDVVSVDQLADQLHCTKTFINNAIKNKIRINGDFYTYANRLVQQTIDELRQELIDFEQAIKKPARRRTEVVNLETKEVFPSIATACRKYNLNADNFSKKIKKRYRINGQFWQYKHVVDQSSIEHELQLCIDREIQVRENTRKNSFKPVVNIDTGEVFESIDAAQKACNLSYGMSAAIKRRHKCGGYYWQYKDVVDKNGIEYERRLCKEKEEEYIQLRIKTGQNSLPRCQKIVDVTNNIVYQNIFELLEQRPITSAALYSAINRRGCLDGSYWCYIDEYEQKGRDQILKDIDDKIKQGQLSHKQSCLRRCRAVVNLNTGEEFESGSAALAKYAPDFLEKGHSIQQYIVNETRLNGYYWQYKDVLEQTQSTPQQELQRILNSKEKKKKQRWKPVKNVDTGEIFESTRAAERKYGLHYNSISGMIRRGYRCGGYRWEYCDSVN